MREAPELGPPRLVEVADGVFGYLQPDGSVDDLVADNGGRPRSHCA